MKNNLINLSSIKDMEGLSFIIPKYQRGYRWTEDQVRDLLEDIAEFMTKSSNGIYCIQPLVVKKHYIGFNMENVYSAQNVEDIECLIENAEIKWEVIDGQQRLTTIHILLSYLFYTVTNERKYPYTITYESRSKDKNSSKLGSDDFLKRLVFTPSDERKDIEELKSSNIDFYYMFSAYQTIVEWFSDKNLEFKSEFMDALRNSVEFIWYETKEHNPIKVFTRLNIGKIALTDAELVKALFLNESNFNTQNKASIRLQQIEIANEWDRIEYQLQKEEFWLFLHSFARYDNPTRIDYIFDLIRKNDKFDLRNSIANFDKKLGTDNHKTFRYFYEYFKLKRKSGSCDFLLSTWAIVKRYFQVFEEWYNDLEMYHYIGYLVYVNNSDQDFVNRLYNQYESSKTASKESFIQEEVKKQIKESIKSSVNLNCIYGEDGSLKTKCRNLLLLLNIQTVINQNKELVKSDKYGMGMFYKFPFHLFKKEGKKNNGKGWEVEHIASNSGDNLEVGKREIWLAAVEYSLHEGEELKQEIHDYLVKETDQDTEANYFKLKDKIKALNQNPLEGNDKQKIWNYTLLDSATNEEYQNDPFPIKRICVLSKDKGKKSIVKYDKTKKNITIVTEDSIAFIPPSTRDIFTKAYSHLPKNISAWTMDDAIAYKEYILNTLKEFGVYE